MKRIPERIVQEIVSRSDIVRIVGEYVRLEKRGGRWTGLCPFHNEKTASFGVNEDKGFFYCFGCKKGGDVITFVKDIEGCGYVEALERLAEKAGVPIVYEGAEDPEAARQARDKDALYELYDRLAGAFHHLLIADDRGRNALAYARSRSLGDEILEGFRLGYAPADRTWLFRFLASKGYSEAFLSSSGLFSQKYPGSSVFADRLIFPIQDARGRTIAFGGRLLSGDGPKYLNSPETSIFRKHETLFALSRAAQAIRTSGAAILCEGYMDALAFHAAGVVHAVAPLGTSFTEAQASLIKRFAPSVIIAFDADTAGIKATERAIGIAEAQGLSVRAFRLAEGKDPAELLEKYGPERLKKEIESTITSDDFLLGVADSIDAQSGLTAAFSYLFPFIAGFSSELRKDVLLEAAAARFKADPASVRADFARFLKKGGGYAAKEEASPASARFEAGPDADLIAAIAACPAMYPRVRSAIGVADFEDEAIKDAFIALEERYRNEDLTVASIVASIASEGLRAFILEKVSSGAYDANTERFIEDGIFRVRERSLENEKRRVVARIRGYSAERDADELSLNDLLYEKMYLDAELAKIKEERNGRS